MAIQKWFNKRSKRQGLIVNVWTTFRTMLLLVVDSFRFIRVSCRDSMMLQFQRNLQKSNVDNAVQNSSFVSLFSSKLALYEYIYFVNYLTSVYTSLFSVITWRFDYPRHEFFIVIFRNIRFMMIIVLYFVLFRLLPPYFKKMSEMETSTLDESQVEENRLSYEGINRTYPQIHPNLTPYSPEPF